MVRVFVYGTLKRGERNHQLLLTATCLGAAVTRDAAFTLREYASTSSPGRITPSVLAGGTHRIAGEVYELDAGLLARLDELERLGVDYERQAVPLASGGAAEIYLRAPASTRPALARLALASIVADVIDWSEVRHRPDAVMPRP